MQILVNRDTKTALSVTSGISIDGQHICYGLEPPTPIPAGVYECWLRWSVKNSHWVIAVMDVPGHTNIEVHIGNTPKDTIDCLVVGMGRTIDLVMQSRQAYTNLMQYVTVCVPNERVTIKYIDVYPSEAHV